MGCHFDEARTDRLAFPNSLDNQLLHQRKLHPGIDVGRTCYNAFGSSLVNADPHRRSTFSDRQIIRQSKQKTSQKTGLLFVDETTLYG